MVFKQRWTVIFKGQKPDKYIVDEKNARIEVIETAWLPKFNNEYSISLTYTDIHYRRPSIIDLLLKTRQLSYTSPSGEKQILRRVYRGKEMYELTKTLQ